MAQVGGLSAGLDAYAAAGGRWRQVAEKEQIGKLAWGQTALIASALLVLLSLARVYLFTGADTAVAALILAVVNRSTVLTSTLLALFAAFGPALVLFKRPRRWLTAGNAIGAPLWLKMRTAVLWIPLSVALIGVTPPILLVGWFTGGALVGLGSIRRRMRARRVNEGQGSAGAPGQSLPGAAIPPPGENLSWWFATLTGFMVLAVLASAWTPKERVELADGRVVTGYLMGEQAGKLLIVTPAKEPVWVAVEDLADRSLCDASIGWWFDPIGSLVDPPTGRVECSG